MWRVLAAQGGPLRSTSANFDALSDSPYERDVRRRSVAVPRESWPEQGFRLRSMVPSPPSERVAAVGRQRFASGFSPLIRLPVHGALCNEVFQGSDVTALGCPPTQAGQHVPQVLGPGPLVHPP